MLLGMEVAVKRLPGYACLSLTWHLIRSSANLWVEVIVSQFTGWPLAVEFGERALELLSMDPIIFLLCLGSRLVTQLFLGISEITRVFISNLTHFPPNSGRTRGLRLSLLAVGLGPCDSVLASGVWAGGYEVIQAISAPATK